MTINETQKWRIELIAREEPDSPDMTYDGTWMWFAAEVSVIHKSTGLTLGTAYLGSCCYDCLEDFAQPGGYLRDMAREAIAEARTNMERLTAEQEVGI